MKIDLHTVLVSAITFGVFFSESLIHYNYGILESKNMPFNWSTILEDFTIPKGKKLAKMMSIVLIASAVSTTLISYVDEKF